ncbi:MAG: hypothetical protein JWP58_2286 [Hymenobacter sp.]|nr:hypothetical protein [Hymenobacter sp.]
MAGGGGVIMPPIIQMRSWLFTSTRVDFSSGTATASAQTTGSLNQVSAAAFDAANHLLFYANRNAVYAANNQLIGQLSAIINPNRQFDETDWQVIGKETAVVPVPGVCSRYYLFYTLSGNYSTVLAYSIIDCASGTPTITSNSQRVDASAIYQASTPGIAASQQAADGTRKLYVASGTAVSSYQLLSGGGLGSATTVKTGNTVGGSCEAELSPNGRYLGWAALGTGSANQVTIFDLNNPAAPLVPFVPTYASGPATGNISGLEFSGGSDKLFITGQGGAAVYTVSTGAQAAIATGSNTLATNTQLELAFDGRLYAASSTGGLLTIDPASLAVAASPLTFTTTPLNTSGVGGSVYGFPDQIDGEYYPTYFGNNAPAVSVALVVDDRILQRNSVTAVYSCKPLTFRTSGTNSPDITRFDITVSSTDASGNPTSTYSYTYSTTTLPVNLGALNGGYLTDPAHTGYYQIRLVGYNNCQSAQSTARMQVSNLTPASADFAFNLCAGTGPRAATTSPTTPAALGMYGGGGIDISFSSGDYDSYQVRFAQYVAGSSPAQFTSIGILATVPKPSGTGLTTISPSYLAGMAGLEPSYFQQGHAGFNTLHRLTLTVSNPCGTSPEVVGYFQTSNVLCRTALADNPTINKAPLYPNPLTGDEAAHLHFSLPTAQPVSLVLTDALTGQVRLTVLHDAPRLAGEQEISFDAARLPAGVYLYRLTTAAGTTVGRLLKAE